MKNILFLILLIVSFQVFGQTPPGYQTRIVRERIQGSHMVDSTDHVPRYCGKPVGVRGGGSIQDGAIAMDTCNNLIYYYSGGIWRTPGVQQIQCGLICSDCGLVTWTGTGLNFYVTAATYNLDGSTYSFAGDSISLAAADATFDRFDAIALTSSGLIKVTGAASASPQLPQFNPCDTILLTNIFVAANTPTPTLITDRVVYDEDAGGEYTHTTTGTIVSNFASTAQKVHGTKSALITAWTSSSNIIFTEGGSVPVNSFTSLSLWIRLTIALQGQQNISIQFFNASAAVSNQVNIPITKSTVNTWQGITLNPSQFTFTSATFTAIRFILTGPPGAAPFYIDWVRLQNGIAQPSIPGQITSAYNRVTDGTNTAIASGADIFKIRAGTGITAVVTNNDGTHGDNILISATGGSGTINSGTTGKPAYYVGATTLDDFAAVDYALTGTNVKTTALNTTDTILRLKGVSSQTAPYLALGSSASDFDIMQVNASGEAIFGGNSDFGDYDMQLGKGMSILNVSNGQKAWAASINSSSTDILYAANSQDLIWLFGTTGSMYLGIGTGSGGGSVVLYSNDINVLTADDVGVKISPGMAYSSVAEALLEVEGLENNDATFILDADDGDNDADTWWFKSVASNNELQFLNHTTFIASLISTGGLRMPEISAPSTPSSATAVIYPKSDGLWYGKDDAGLETKLSNDAGGSQTLQQVLTTGSTLTIDNEIILTNPKSLFIRVTDESYQSFESNVSAITPRVVTYLSDPTADSISFIDVSNGNIAISSKVTGVGGKIDVNKFGVDISLGSDDFYVSSGEIGLLSTAVLVSPLAGTGSRAVLADASGYLSAPVSDRSVKRNINSLDYGLNTIMKLKPVSFEYIDKWERYGKGKQVGFIAQDVQKVLPNSTFITPSTGKMGYNETDIIPILVKAIQEQQLQIEQLQKQINELKYKR